MNMPVIQCGVCQKPIERWGAWRFEASFPGVEIQVWCHGATDRMFMADNELDDLSAPPAIIETVAFRTAVLTSPSQPATLPAAPPQPNGTDK